MDSEAVGKLYERMMSASHTGFPALCGELFRVIDTTVSPTNGVYQSLQKARTEKWNDWAPMSGRGRRWSMPVSAGDCESLAWDLFRTFAEVPDSTISFQLEMYHHRKIDENHSHFLKDFGEFLADALNKVLQGEEPVDPDSREKQQKFRILDAPNLLAKDLTRAPGLLGRAVIYLDLDNFKALNSKYTERVVDEAVLPIVHIALRDAAHFVGHAYAEGGDEFIVFLPNASKAMAAAFAEDLRRIISELSFQEPAEAVKVNASLGVAWQATADGRDLPGEANHAKLSAKTAGKNRVVVA